MTTNSTANFDLPLARPLAADCEAVYDMNCVVLESDKTDAAVMVKDVPDGTATILAFRGTRNLKDWAADLKFLKRPIARGVKLHGGFLEDADSLLPKIIERILPSGQVKERAKPLIITGHSLGGALASIVAYFLQREGFNVQCVYTFASPRAGNAGWRDAYLYSGLWAKTFRIVRAGDAVPLLPGILCPPLDGYRHVGTEVFLMPGGHMAINPWHLYGAWVDEFSIWRALHHGQWDWILDLHEISGYEAELKSVALISGL